MGRKMNNWEKKQLDSFKKKLKDSFKETKLIIIENYIDWYTTNEEERDILKKEASVYVDEDWVDETEQSL